MKISEDTERDIHKIALYLENIKSYADERNGIMVMQRDELCRIADKLERIAEHLEK